jgi:hypothetical protein
VPVAFQQVPGRHLGVMTVSIAMTHLAMERHAL